MVKEAELPGMPPASALTLTSEQYLAAREKLEKAKNDLKDRGSDLAAAFVKAKKTQMKINGKLIRFSQDTKTLIKVSTPREQ